jgi:hypothetical protein
VSFASSMLVVATVSVTMDGGAAAGGKGKKAMAVQQQVTVEPQAEGVWRVKARREGHGASGEGLVVMRSPSRPDPVPAALAGLAGARAWLGLARKRLDAADWQGAIALAREGLRDLGTDYAEPEVDDSTDLKIHAAEDLIQKGQIENGARTLTGTLENRVALAVDRHRRLLAE